MYWQWFLSTRWWWGHSGSKSSIVVKTRGASWSWEHRTSDGKSFCCWDTASPSECVFIVCVYASSGMISQGGSCLLWHCWLGLLTCKTVSHITCTVLVETLNHAQSINQLRSAQVPLVCWWLGLSNRIWSPTISPWMKQLMWLRIVHSGDWCLHMALCTSSRACQKSRRSCG